MTLTQNHCPLESNGSTRSKGDAFSVCLGKDVCSSQGPVLRGILCSIWKGPVHPKDNLDLFSSPPMLNELHRIYLYIKQPLCQWGISQSSTVAQVCTLTRQGKSMAHAGCETAFSQIHFQHRAETLAGFGFPYRGPLAKQAPKGRLTLLLSL